MVMERLRGSRVDHCRLLHSWMRLDVMHSLCGRRHGRVYMHARLNSSSSDMLYTFVCMQRAGGSCL